MGKRELRLSLIIFLCFLPIKLFAFDLEEECRKAGPKFLELYVSEGLGDVSLDVLKAHILSSQLNSNPIITPNMIQKYKSRKLAEILVNHLRLNCDEIRNDSERFQFEMYRNSEVILSLPHQAVKSVATDGFLNQHFVRKTGGYLKQDRRIRAEHEFAGLSIPYSVRAKYFLPKYAYFNIKKTGYAPPIDAINSDYGDMLFVLKDSVKRRTTWANDDSLSKFHFSAEYGKVNLAQWYPHRTTYFRDEKSPSFECTSESCEAQIWGELDFTDVKHVLVSESKLDSSGSYKKSVEFLAKQGLEIYFNKERSSQTVLASAGKQISAKNPKLTKAAKKFSKEKMQRRIANLTDGVVKNIKRFQLLEKMNDDELIGLFKNAKRIDESDKYEDSNSQYHLLDLVGELGSRHSKQAYTVLQKVADSENYKASTRSQALLGLVKFFGESAAKKSAIEASILRASQDADLHLRITSMRLIKTLFPNSKKTKIKSALAALKNDESAHNRQWYKRLFESNQYCEPLQKPKSK